MAEPSSDFYTRLAPYYDQLFGCDDAILAFLRRHGAAPGMRVLDIACGSGACMRQLLTQGIDVHGIDLSEELIAQARRLAIPGGVWTSGGVTDRYALGNMLEVDHHPLSPFDMAYCVGNSVAHLPDMVTVGKFVRTVARALRPGAPFVVQYVALRDFDIGTEKDLPTLSVPGARFHRKYTRTSATSIQFDGIVEIDNDSQAMEIRQDLLVIDLEEMLDLFNERSWDSVQVFGDFEDGAPGPESWLNVMVAHRGLWPTGRRSPTSAAGAALRHDSQDCANEEQTATHPKE